MRTAMVGRAVEAVDPGRVVVVGAPVVKGLHEHAWHPFSSIKLSEYEPSLQRQTRGTQAEAVVDTGTSLVVVVAWVVEGASVVVVVAARVVVAAVVEEAVGGRVVDTPVVVMDLQVHVRHPLSSSE